MGVHHDRVRERLGRIGAWTFAFDARRVAQVREDAATLESLGYSAIWIPEGSDSRDVFAHLSWLLSSTDRAAVCSGIANITARQPEVMQAGFVTLADAFGDRVVGGIGIGHEYSTEARGMDWDRPLTRMRHYLDRMDAADALPAPDPPPQRLLAALGDGMLRLSAECALGAHSYFVPVAHTAHAREMLGPEPVLAVELTAVFDDDLVTARRTAHAWAGGYLGLPNYAKNLIRMGFSDEDVAGDGSDALIDATIPCGDAHAVAERVRAHLDAGADHVCVQFVSADEADVRMPAYGSLAELLLSDSSV